MTDSTRVTRAAGGERMILHVDMDAFYASVEARENPELAGLPLVVGGRPSGRGVVAAASYEARKYGIHSAMPMATAVKKCRELVIVKPNASLYNEVALEIRAIFGRYTPVIEPLSLDEAFLDPRGSERLYGGAVEIGRRIKSDIRDELKLVASVGVAPNKFLAKLASDHDKPDGFTVIEPDAVREFLDPLPVGRIWGVGKSARARLSRHGIHTVRDARKCSQTFLDNLFGAYGAQLWRLARGLDEREVVTDGEVKSISQETTFERDVSDYSVMESVAFHLAEEVGYRVREAGLRGRTVHLKIRFDDFRTITRSLTRPSETDATGRIWDSVREMLERVLGSGAFSVRLVGVGLSNFAGRGPVQSSLFDSDGDVGGAEAGDPIDRLADEIRRKYGKGVIRRGKSTPP